MGGYSLSKWVAERLISQARERGLPASIYRFGRIGGDTRSGAGNVNDFLSLMLKGCIQLGKVTDWSGGLGLTPVNYLSCYIVALALNGSKAGATYHLCPPGNVA